MAMMPLGGTLKMKEPMTPLVKQLMVFDHTYRYSDSLSTYNHWEAVERKLKANIAEIPDKATRDIYTAALCGNVEPLIAKYGTLSQETVRVCQEELQERLSTIKSYHLFLAFLNDLANIMGKYIPPQQGIVYTKYAPAAQKIDGKISIPESQQLELNDLIERTNTTLFRDVEKIRFKLKLPSTTVSLSCYTRTDNLTHFRFITAENNTHADFELYLN